MLIIETPIKIWGLKYKNKYTDIDCVADIDDIIFDYTHHGNVVFNPKLDWNNHKRTYIIKYYHYNDWAELKKGLNIDNNAPPTQELCRKYVAASHQKRGWGVRGVVNHFLV